MGVADLADYPWDSVAPYAARAAEHPDGIVDLSIGSPVDTTPPVVAEALAAATDAHSYPQTVGTTGLRDAVVAWYARRRGSRGPDARACDAHGRVQGARRAPAAPARPRTGRCRRAPARRVSDLRGRCTTRRGDPARRGRSGRSGPKAHGWSGSTRRATPTGGCWMPPALRSAVARARQLGAVLASDECYAELGWDAPWDTEPIPSVLDPRVTGGDLRGILSVYSLSKQSNLAGYRAAFVAGDPAVVEPARRRAQAPRADAARSGAVRHDRSSGRRRACPSAEGALPGAARTAQAGASRPPASASTAAKPGSTCGRPRAETRGRACRDWPSSASWRAPGISTARTTPDHIRLSLTATDERVQAAAARLRAAS